MSNYVQKDMNGSMFRNKKKTTENQPDFKGDVKVGGKDYQIAAWTKVDRNGDKFLSLKFSPPFTPDPAFRKERPPRQEEDWA